MAKDAEHFLLCLYAIFICSWVKCTYTYWVSVYIYMQNDIRVDRIFF